MFATLAWEYEWADIASALFLYDMARGRVFEIAEDKRDVARAIIRGASLSELERKYGNTWIEFQHELEANNAVVYLDHLPEFRDVWDYGSRKFIAQDTSLLNTIKEISIDFGSTYFSRTPTPNDTQQVKMYTCMQIIQTPKMEYNLVEQCFELIQAAIHYGLGVVIFEGSAIFADHLLQKAIRRRIGELNLPIYVKASSSLLAALSDEELTSIRQLFDEATIFVYDDGESGNQDTLAIMQRARNAKLNIAPRNDSLLLEESIQCRGRGSLSTVPNLSVSTIAETENTCMAGRLFVSSQGLIGPCRLFLSEIGSIGSLSDTDYSQVFVKANEVYKDLNLDLKACRDCVNRRHCTRCVLYKEQ